VSERIDNLKLLIERSEKCPASHVASTVVRLPYGEGNEMAWEGVVETFDMRDHPDGIRRAYAWMRPARKGEEAEYKVVLGKPPVNSPEDAVKAAIAAIYRGL
jgi:hypothetical protein